MTLDFPNSTAQLSLYQEQCCFNTQVHTHAHEYTLTHTLLPLLSKDEHIHTPPDHSTMRKAEGEGDEEGVREMENVKAQDERGKESIGAAMCQSTNPASCCPLSLVVFDCCLLFSVAFFVFIMNKTCMIFFTAIKRV